MSGYHGSLTVIDRFWVQLRCMHEFFGRPCRPSLTVPWHENAESSPSEILLLGDLGTLWLLDLPCQVSLRWGNCKLSQVQPTQWIHWIIRNLCVLVMTSTLCSDHCVFTLLVKQRFYSKWYKMPGHTPPGPGWMRLAVVY